LPEYLFTHRCITEHHTREIARDADLIQSLYIFSRDVSFLISFLLLSFALYYFISEIYILSLSISSLLIEHIYLLHWDEFSSLRDAKTELQTFSIECRQQSGALIFDYFEYWQIERHCLCFRGETEQCCILLSLYMVPFLFFMRAISSIYYIYMFSCRRFFERHWGVCFHFQYFHSHFFIGEVRLCPACLPAQPQMPSAMLAKKVAVRSIGVTALSALVSGISLSYQFSLIYFLHYRAAYHQLLCFQHRHSPCHTSGRLYFFVIVLQKKQESLMPSTTT